MVLSVQQVYNRSTQILKRIDAGSRGNLVTIYQPGLVTPWDRTSTLRYYGFITDLRAKVDINSLAPTELPNLDIGTSQSERAAIIRDQEWTSPRYELDLLMRSTYSGGWHSLVSLSLLNRLPFYILNLQQYLTDQVAFNVANDAVLGCQIRNVGQGFLAGSDSIIIYGSAREEVTTVPTESPEVISSNNLSVSVGASSSSVLPANPYRKSATFVNTSAAGRISLSYQTDAVEGAGIVLYPNGGSYEINQSNLYRGTVNAIASQANCTLAITEGL